MADDISRRIDDLLSGAIDEQVREQRALNDTMLGVRDGVSRLVGDVAALSARVTESRETSQGLREELPFLVQREVTSAVNAVSTRIDVLETAVGELVASIAGLEDRVGPDVIVSGVSERLESLRSSDEQEAGAVTAEAARSAIEQAAESLRVLFEDESGAMRSSFEESSSASAGLIERNYAQVQKRMTEMKKWADEVETRMRSLEKSLEANIKLPADVRKQLSDLTGATQDMTDSVLEEIRINADAGANRIAQSVRGIDSEAGEMNRRFAEMNERMAAFQEEVLAYLQVRDVALEERRDQIVTELLADFLNELPEKDRERTVGRLRTVFARRRDKRDADRYRTGGPSAATTSVSPEARARAEAEMQREQRLAARPWAERPYAEPAHAPSPPAFPETVDEEPYVGYAEEGEPYFEEPAERTPPPRKPRTTRTVRPAAKKKAAAKKAATKKKVPQAEVPQAEVPQAEVPQAEVPRPEKKPVAAKPAKRARAKPVPVTRSLPVSDEAGEGAAPVSFEEPVFEQPQAGGVQAEVDEMKGVSESPADSPAVEEEAPASPAPDETLQQALARVKELVDQHRKPAGGRKTKT